MKVIIKIAFKGAIQDFQNLPTAPRTLQQVRSSGHGAIVCKSRVTHRALITCNMACTTWYKGTAPLFDRVEIAFISVLFYWLIPLTHEGE